MKSEHTFVICAYQESPYLEECIQSVLAQKEDGAVLIATATPNDHIQALADRYGLEALLQIRTLLIGTNDKGVLALQSITFSRK